MSKIGKLLGCSDKTVRKALLNFDIPLRKRASEVLTKDFLEKRLSAGEGPYSIAKETGFSAPAVYQSMYKHGLAESEDDEALADRVIGMYVKGYKSTDIAAKLGRTFTFVLNTLHRNQVSLREVNYYRKKIPEDNEMVREYLDEGLSIRQIAEKYGVEKSAVWQALNRIGTKLRSRSEATKGHRNHMQDKKQSVRARENMSKAYKEGVRDVHEMAGRGHPTPLETPHQGTVTTRSTWEAAVGRYLNEVGVEYLYEPHVLDIKVNGITTTYKPDFYILEDSNYIEVKGAWTEEAWEKVQAAKETYDILIWDADKLQRLGIIDNSLRLLI